MMVEKRAERRNTASPGDASTKYKGDVRIVSNSNLANLQGLALTPKNGGKHHQQYIDGTVRKCGSRSTPVHSPVLMLSPSSRQDSPKLKGIGGFVSSSPSSRESSPRTSPTLGCNYAGAKFSEPPSPDSLPKPPPHWTGCFYISTGGFPILTPDKMDKYWEINEQLKVILKVPA